METAISINYQINIYKNPHEWIGMNWKKKTWFFSQFICSFYFYVWLMTLAAIYIVLFCIHVIFDLNGEKNNFNRKFIYLMMVISFMISIALRLITFYTRETISIYKTFYQFHIFILFYINDRILLFYLNIWL